MKKLLKITFTLFFTTIIVLGFAVPVNMPNGTWYQQFMPPINNRPISDISFLDSLTGFAVTPYVVNDTAYILKTTNGGDNWTKVFVGATNSIGGFNGVQFLNLSTGYVCGNFLRKTTNGGINWFTVNTSGIFPLNMHVLNTDTMWLIDSDIFAGGVFFTSNGGASWQNQFSGSNQNPNKIYMYNARIGYISNSSALPNIYKTTNGGLNWNINLPGEYFTDMYFTDSLTGWKCMPGFIAGDSCVKKTTNGGLSWFKQILPTGGIINLSQIVKFSFLNKDTIYGVGGQVNYGGSRYRGIIYKTINGGNNWLFQVPDTSFGIAGFGSIQFINKNVGWAYFNAIGIHTTNGGDTTFIVGLQQVSTEVPREYKLYQNYPNPFNPNTKIKFSIPKTSSVAQTFLSVYNINGKQVSTLINQQLAPGTYDIGFNASGLASGVYFYKLSIATGNDVLTDTKKMILIK